LNVSNAKEVSTGIDNNLHIVKRIHLKRLWSEGTSTIYVL